MCGQNLDNNDIRSISLLRLEIAQQSGKGCLILVVFFPMPKITDMDRYLKFSCWLPAYFAARLLSINKWSLSPSQETDDF